MTRRTEELRSSDIPVGARFHSPINTIEDAIRVSLPTKKREAKFPQISGKSSQSGDLVVIVTKSA